MRTIELSIKKRMKRMNLTALLLGGVCLLCQPLQAQQSIDACDGRTYKVGDTLRIGEPLLSGYLFVKQLNANNQFDKLNPKNSTGRTAVITDIPAYQPKLYQQFGIYQQPETPQIVFAEQGRFQDWRISKHGFNQRKHHVRTSCFPYGWSCRPYPGYLVRLHT